MSIAITGKQITDGLIFAYDTFNVKSYVGEPTTNCFYTPTPDASGNTSFSVQGNGTFIRILSGSYGGYEIMPNDVVYRYDLGATGCHYHGNDYNIPAGNYVTFTFDYFVNATGYPDTNFLANIENGGNGLTAGFTDPTPSIQGVWKTWSYSPPAASTGTGFSRFLLYPGGCGGGRLATGGYILYKNPRAEFNKQHATPFVISGPSSVGTRSNTQGLLDITKNYTIDLTNAGYTANADLNFAAASSNYISAGSGFANFTTGVTCEFWAKFTSTSYTWERLMDFGVAQQSSNIIFCRYSNTNDLWVEFYGVGPSASATMNLRATGAITNNAFAHYAFTANGTRVNIYKNGVLHTTGLSSQLPTNVTRTNTWIGRSNWSGDSYFQGSIPLSRIYSRALSGDEILKNYNATKGRYGL